jgi:hypothetical protein
MGLLVTSQFYFRVLRVEVSHVLDFNFQSNERGGGDLCFVSDVKPM